MPPISGPIAPIPRRCPAYPCCRPEPVINNGTVDIDRFDDVVLAIKPGVTYNLYMHLVCFVFLHRDRRYILVNILSQHGLDDDEVRTITLHLHDTQVVHDAVAVEVEIGDMTLLGVELLLKLLQITYFAKEGGDSTQVEVLANVGTCGRHCDCLVRTGYKVARYEQNSHQKITGGLHNCSFFKRFTSITPDVGRASSFPSWYAYNARCKGWVQSLSEYFLQFLCQNSPNPLFSRDYWSSGVVFSPS